MPSVLACLDLTETDDLVVAEATTLAARSGDDLILLHVAAPEPDLVGYDREPLNPNTSEDRAVELRDEWAVLSKRADEALASGVGAVPRMTVAPTAEGILAEADQTDAAVIVVAAHRRGAVHRLLVGSTVTELLQRARRPILVVPAGMADPAPIP